MARTLHVVIPVYNERGTLKPCLDRVLDVTLPEGWSIAIVMIDDASDETHQSSVDSAVKHLRSSGATVDFQRHTTNQGKGAALRTGFDAILAGGELDDDLVTIQDADLEYDPSDYAALMDPILSGRADATIGTRWGKHRPPVKLVHKIHQLGNGTLTLLSNLMTGYRVRDMECCYKMFSVGLLRRLRPQLTENRFGIEPQMVASLAKLHSRVEEVPVNYSPRGFGEGKKIGWRDALAAVFVIARERLKPMTGSMAEESESAKLLFSPRKLIFQVLAFLLGLALLIWCIRSAFVGGDWSALQHAPPLLLAGLAGCTLVSLFVNAAVFWVTIQPVQPLRFKDLLLVNVVASALNYAPVRAGLIARVAYHMRVDRMKVIVLGGWFAAVGFTFVAAMAAAVAATLIRGKIDIVWGLLLIGILVVIGAASQFALRRQAAKRIGRGMDRMLSEPRGMWGGLALRVVDIGAYAGRMGCAAAILKLSLTATDIVLLAIAAIATSLVPLGRVGYREAGVAIFAGFIGMSGSEFDAARNQLALVESAGEAIVCLPLGVASLFWYRARWKAARINT